MNLINNNGVGYDIRDREGKISLKKFENALDWSLDTIKLQESYERETRKRNFYFVSGGKKYTQMVINVKFSYSFAGIEKNPASGIIISLRGSRRSPCRGEVPREW